MRAIDGDALKRKAQKVATEAWKMKLTAKIETTLNQFIDWIDAQPTVHSEPQWIPVEHDLPKENYLDDGYVEPSQPVLVYMSYHTCKISRYWGNRKSKGTSDYVIPDWMDLEEYDGDNVIAWRELPEPYKGDTE